MTGVTVRTMTPQDWPEFTAVVEAAFFADHGPEYAEPYRVLFEPERFHGVYESGRLLGAAGIQSRDLTLPGVGPSPVAAVTGVGVALDARRRGVLTTAMRAQLDALHQSAAEPVAALWASEAPIYGRFGYGCASRAAKLAVPTQAEFRPDVEPVGRVELVAEPAGRPILRAVHRAVVPRRVGWLSRVEAHWTTWLADTERRRHGASAYRYVVHHGVDGPDGYAVFRVKASFGPTGPDSELFVREFVTADPQAGAALWRFLLDVDLVGKITYENMALDDPLQDLLLNPRGSLTSVHDQLWVRLVDLNRALAARSYSAPCDVVLELTDGFCPWNAGRWRLEVDDAGTAEVTRTDAAPDLRCDVADLGAAYLGGPRLAGLAAAGRVHELREGTIAAVSLAMAGDVEPHCPEIF